MYENFDLTMSVPVLSVTFLAVTCFFCYCAYTCHLLIPKKTPF